MKDLRFTPYAWAKLRYIQEIGDTEVSFMALTKRPELNLVVDVLMVPQECSQAFTEFKPDGLADFFERMVDAGHHPEEFGRIWCHTHPMASASPSGTDETTFKREFSSPNWAIMFIIGNQGATTCRLRYKPHPDLAHIVEDGGSKELTVFVDFKAPFKPSDHEAWKAEYVANWSRKSYVYANQGNYGYQGNGKTADYSSISVAKVWEPSAGWRRTGHTWTHTKSNEIADIANGINTPAKWYQAHGTPEEKAKYSRTAIGFGNKGLSKRERKYLKKHGNLVGFNAPTNPGYKRKEQQLIKIEKLETSRNLLNDWDQVDDATWRERKQLEAHDAIDRALGLEPDDYEWDQEQQKAWAQRRMEEEGVAAGTPPTFYTVILTDGDRFYNIPAYSATGAMDDMDYQLDGDPAGEMAYTAIPQDKELKLQNWKVTLDDGRIFKNVPGYDGTDAENRVRMKLGLEPVQGAEKDLLIIPDTEPSDEQLVAIEKEDELTLLPEEDTVLDVSPGLVAYKDAEDKWNPIGYVD